MESDCCGPPVPALEPAPALPATEEGACQSGCCGRQNVETLAAEPPIQKVPDEEKIEDDCCGAGKCANDVAKEDSDAPDCCRGKANPCCDTSCLDRLALRECGMSAAGSSESIACCNTTEGEACSEHTLSALDRYGATLRALGCLCRTLIALGQETCCEIRERHSLDGNQPSKKPSVGSVRTSLDSGHSSGSVTKNQAAENSLRLRKGFKESVQSVKVSPVGDACGGSCCSKEKPALAPSLRSKGPTTCCSEGKGGGSPPNGKDGNDCCAKADILPSGAQAGSEGLCCTDKQAANIGPTGGETGCSGSCCSSAEPSKQAASQSESPGCCSEDISPGKSPVKTSCVDSCCASKAPDKQVVSHAERPACGSETISPGKPSLEIGCSGSCCRGDNGIGVNDTKRTSVDSCCADKPVGRRSGSCADACCSSTAPDARLGIEKGPIEAVSDIENQGTGNERVVLSISGMTCTGCETKLNRTLATVPAVKNLKTSLVLSRAEFHIDLRLGSVEEVMKHLERTTEFKCERIQSQGSSLDFIISNDQFQSISSEKWPDGVTDIALVGKQTARVTFDPKIVGARDLAEKVWRLPTELAPLRADPSLEAGSKHVRHVGYMTLLSAVLTIPVLVMAWAPLPENEVAYSSASMALATIVQFVIAGPFYPKALKALVFSKVIEMDLLIVLSTSAAYIFSVVSFGYLIAGSPLSTGQFFETSTLLVTLIMLGRWVAALARQRAVETISVRSLQPSKAILIDEENGTELEIDARLLQYGDIFKVLPDTRIPTDGTVIRGSSEVDESMLTGESRPVEKFPKSGVIAGSINGSGVMIVRLGRLPSDNTINTIAAMVDEAKLSKPKLQDLADKVASYFVPVVVALTIITFVIWVAVGMTIRGYNGSEATIEAITYAITVLIVSCPCAIGLAVPMVIVIASGVAAERGVVFKSADAIEVAHKTSHVVFDKTGTLTRGKLSVVETHCNSQDKLPFLLGLIENSRHPVSVAVSAHLNDAGLIASPVPEPKSLTGKGVESTLNGQKLQAGNSRWLNLSDHEHVESMLARGYTVFCFAIDGVLVAVYGLEDELRSDAADTLEALEKIGVAIHLVSGDDDGAVQNLAAKLGIPANNVRARSSPADKRDYIQALLDTNVGGKKPIVVFCGDGTNDAVALAQATIGVHMNEGTDIAQSAADVVLMRPALSGILVMINASRKSVNRIKFNFGWSFVYNTFAVLLAAGAFVNARIPPEFAGLGELVSVLPVIAAAVLLRWSAI
ncbi:unnamed protein product [Clonostachys solani]|uniref:HMA domain-containing protein n=1 Tax=Clonostachys solani TaxID=160281 RepID=A0A9N9ZH84_9HYPO|nr:unnamed protein product [Clonostachys solani]